MTIFNRVVLLSSLLFVLSVQCGFADTTTPPSSIRTLADFEKSEFSKKYECKRDKRGGFKLPNGKINYIYESNLRSPDGTAEPQIDVVTKGGRIESLDITFEGVEYSESPLTGKEYEIIECFLRSVSRIGDLKSAIEFIKHNIEGLAPQLPNGPPFRYGPFNISAGRIANHQQVYIERIKK